LADRLFNDPNHKCNNFSFTPGPNATPESVCREINKAMDQIEAGDYDLVEDIDG